IESKHQMAAGRPLAGQPHVEAMRADVVFHARVEQDDRWRLPRRRWIGRRVEDREQASAGAEAHRSLAVTVAFGDCRIAALAARRRRGREWRTTTPDPAA